MDEQVRRQIIEKIAQKRGVSNKEVVDQVGQIAKNNNIGEDEALLRLLNAEASEKDKTLKVVSVTEPETREGENGTFTFQQIRGYDENGNVYRFSLFNDQVGKVKEGDYITVKGNVRSGKYGKEIRVREIKQIVAKEPFLKIKPTPIPKANKGKVLIEGMVTGVGEKFVKVADESDPFQQVTAFSNYINGNVKIGEGIKILGEVRVNDEGDKILNNAIVV